MFFKLVLFQLLKSFSGPKAKNWKGRKNWRRLLFFNPVGTEVLGSQVAYLGQVLGSDAHSLPPQVLEEELVGGWHCQIKRQDLQEQVLHFQQLSFCVGVISYVDKLVYLGRIYFFIFPTKGKEFGKVKPGPSDSLVLSQPGLSHGPCRLKYHLWIMKWYRCEKIQMLVSIKSISMTRICHTYCYE